MGRKRSAKVSEVKRKLVERLDGGHYRPGDRFLSARALAERFGISYQTAHRLLVEMCDEGRLERRPQSGTYVPGGAARPVGVQFVFHRRARRKASFGAKLLGLLTERLDADRIDYRRTWATPGKPVKLADDRVPVLWECPATLKACIAADRPTLLLGDRPAFGIGALRVDSISQDDRGGGAMAGDLLVNATGRRDGYAVLGGPSDDARSQLRIDGFRSVAEATVVHAGGWYEDDGYAAARKAVNAARAGLFCCNDRLAQGVIRWCREQGRDAPPIVGFDDAPIAERLGLTTIAIPWDELVHNAARVIRRRIDGDRAASSHQLFNPRPVVRSTGGGAGATPGSRTRSRA